MLLGAVTAAALLGASAAPAASPAGVSEFYRGRRGINSAHQAAPAPLPKWEPVWQLNRSTAAVACNYSGYLEPFFAEFGLVEIDWSNNKHSWMAAQPKRCEEDLVEQARRIKVASRQHSPHMTKALVYRNALVTDPFMSSQFKFYSDSAATKPNPQYEGFFVHYRNGSLFQFDHGNGVEYMYEQSTEP